MCVQGIEAVLAPAIDESVTLQRRIRLALQKLTVTAYAVGAIDLSAASRLFLRVNPIERGALSPSRRARGHGDKQQYPHGQAGARVSSDSTLMRIASPCFE